jgi:outer membrane protein assembly factor BamB
MMSNWGYSESPLVDGNKVIATPGGGRGTLAAFDRKTGEVLWRSKEVTDSAGYSSVIAAQIGGVKQYIQLTGKSVFGVAPETGKVLWRHAREGRTAVIPTPIVSDNYVYITSGYNAGCDLIKLTPTGGVFKAEEVYRSKDMTNHHGGVVLLDGYLYGHSDAERGKWVCQDLKTGEVKWSSKALGKGCVTYADGRLYCYEEDKGIVVLAEASPRGWSEKGRFTITPSTLEHGRGKIWAHPVVANGRLYLRDQDLIFCYDVKAAN